MRRRRQLLAMVGTAVIFAPAGVAVAVAAPSSEAKLYQEDAAIERLGERLPQVAAAHGASAKQLRNALRTDPTLAVNHDDRVIWLDPVHDGTAFDSPAEQALQGEEEVDLAEPFPILHSDPGQTNKIYLDFDGGTYGPGLDNADTGTSSILSSQSTIPAFSGGSEAIHRIWQRVAEDWAPFNVDVTTERPLQMSPGILVSVGGTPANAGFPSGVGGVAPWIGGGSLYSGPAKIVFVFSEAYGDDEAGVADTISHEGGHIFGLDHDGPDYYGGHGSDATAWSPIMGAGGLALSHWSKGEYPGASNTEDDVARITSDLTGRADDNSAGQALGGDPAAVDQGGMIETASDTDDFSFDTAGGPVSFTIEPGPQGPNLDAQLGLLDDSGNLVAEANDPSGLGGTITATLGPGRYHLRVDGVGDLDPLPGYSDYASLGQYRITGSYPGAGAPEQMRAPKVTVTGRKAIVKWTSANANGSAITRYKVDISKGKDRTLAAGARKTVFKKLKPGRYQVRVTARNALGTGPYSSWSKFRIR